MKSLHIDILRQILAVLRDGDQFENDLGYQVFGIFYNDPKCPGIPTQNPVNQVFVCRIISNGMVHALDQTGKLD